MRKRKICMFTINNIDIVQTGGNRRFKELYQHLKANGNTVDMYCSGYGEKMPEDNKGVQLLNTDNKRFRMLKIPSLVLCMNNMKKYRDIRDAHYDLVIAFDVPSAIGLCLMGIEHVQFFIRQDLLAYRRIQYASKNMNFMKANFLLLIGWLMESLCITHSETIWSQCRYDLDVITKRHPLLRKKIGRKAFVQINNINPSWIRESFQKARKEVNRKRYDIVFVGNFDDERKGHRILLEALELLYGEKQIYAAVLLGGGKDLEKYRFMYKRYANIEFPGYVVNPMGYIINANLMVVPSLEDSCPNTIMEALYCETPVIGAKAGGIPEILNNSSWTFELDAGRLAHKIRTLFAGGGLNHLKDAQKIRARELTFDWGEKITDLFA